MSDFLWNTAPLWLGRIAFVLGGAALLIGGFGALLFAVIERYCRKEFIEFLDWKMGRRYDK